jgi:hypothetical protein
MLWTWLLFKKTYYYIYIFSSILPSNLNIFYSAWYTLFVMLCIKLFGGRVVLRFELRASCLKVDTLSFLLDLLSLSLLRFLDFFSNRIYLFDKFVIHVTEFLFQILNWLLYFIHLLFISYLWSLIFFWAYCLTFQYLWFQLLKLTNFWRSYVVLLL